MSSNDRRLQKVSGIEAFIRVSEALSFARAAQLLGQARARYRIHPPS